MKKFIKKKLRGKWFKL